MIARRLITPEDRRLCSLTGKSLRLGAAGRSVSSFAVWSATDIEPGVALSADALTATVQSGFSGPRSARATVGISAGKWYWEQTVNRENESFVGISTSGSDVLSTPGYANNGWSYYQGNGFKVSMVAGVNPSQNVAYGTAWLGAATIGIALDMDAGQITFFNNGVSQGIAFSNVSGMVHPHVAMTYANTAMTANFGQTDFVYPVPAGFNAGVYE